MSGSKSSVHLKRRTELAGRHHKEGILQTEWCLNPNCGEMGAAPDRPVCRQSKQGSGLVPLPFYMDQLSMGLDALQQSGGTDLTYKFPPFAFVSNSAENKSLKGEGHSNGPVFASEGLVPISLQLGLVVP